MKRKGCIAVIYNPWRQEAQGLARSIVDLCGVDGAFVVSLGDLDARIEEIRPCDLLVSAAVD